MIAKLKQLVFGSAPGSAAHPAAASGTDDASPLDLLTGDANGPAAARPPVDLRQWEREEVQRLLRLVDESQSGQTAVSLDGVRTIREAWTSAGRRYLGDHWDRQAKDGVKLITLNKTQNVVKTHLAFEVEQPAHVHFDPLVDDGARVIFLKAKAGRKLLRSQGSGVRSQLTDGQLAGEEPVSEELYEELVSPGIAAMPVEATSNVQQEETALSATPAPSDQLTDQPINQSTNHLIAGQTPRLSDDDFHIIDARTKSERVQAIWDDKWDAARGEYFRLENALLTGIFGHCPWHFWYDLAEHRFGFENRHVCMVFPPTTQTEIGRFDYLLMRQYVPREQMKREHPEWAAELDAAADRFGGGSASGAGMGPVTLHAAEGARIAPSPVSVTFDRDGFAYANTDWQRDMVKVLTAWERYHQFPLPVEEALAAGLVVYEPWTRQEALTRGLIEADVEETFLVAAGAAPNVESGEWSVESEGKGATSPHSTLPTPLRRYTGPRHQLPDGSWHTGEARDAQSLPLTAQSRLRGYLTVADGRRTAFPRNVSAYRRQRDDAASNWPGRYVLVATGEECDPGDPGDPGDPSKSEIRNQESETARAAWFPTPHWRRPPSPNWPTRPAIRQLQVLEDIGRVIEDVPCPYTDMPFAWNRAGLIPWSPYGIGDPMGLESLQDFANRLATYIFHQVRMNAYGQEYLPEELKAALTAQGINAHSSPNTVVGVDAETFREFVLPLLQSGANFAMKPEQPTGEAIGLLFRVLELMDDLGQHADVLQGRAPTTSASGELTKVLTSNASGPLALKGRLADWSLQRIGELSLHALLTYVGADPQERDRYLADLPAPVRAAMWDAIVATPWRVTVEQRGASKLLAEEKAEKHLELGAISMQTYREKVGIKHPIEKRRLDEEAHEKEQATPGLPGAMPGLPGAPPGTPEQPGGSTAEAPPAGALLPGA